MRMPDCSAGAPPRVQRICTECEEELHRKEFSSPPSLLTSFRPPRGTAVPLPESVRSYFEPRFGWNFGHVRIHTDSAADQSARSVGALAYTAGSDIIFAKGHYSPDTMRGRRLLAHELTHVIQQGSRRSDGTIQRACLSGVPVTPDCVPDPTITPPSERFRFNVNCDDFASGEEARLDGFAASLSPTATIRIVGLASFDGPADLNARLSCSRAQRGLAVIQRSAPAGATITSVDASVGGPATVGDPNMRAVGIEVSTPETITSETVVTSPAPRTRTTIGVGEEVNLTHSPGAADWTTTAGTLSAANGITVLLTAPDTAQRITVTAGRATISFDIVAPTSVAMDREPGTGVKHTRDRADSGIQTRVFLGPGTVNFSRVRYRERDVPGVPTIPGAYACNTFSTGHCSGAVAGACPDKALTDTVVAGMGTRSVLGDCAYSGHCGGGPPFVPGSITVSIPYEYRVGTGPFRRIVTVAQVHILHAGAATLTSSKAGANGSTTVASPTVTIPACP